MLITKQIEIDCAHRVPNHGSKCRNLHGHRYKIEVGINDKIISEEGNPVEGMVIDFSDLKQIMMDYIDEKYDHGAIFYENDKYRDCLEAMIALGDQREDKLHFVSFIPTVENLCKMWYELIETPLKDRNIAIAYVKVWETPTSTAIYTIEDRNEDFGDKDHKKYQCIKCENDYSSDALFNCGVCSNCEDFEDVPF